VRVEGVPFSRPSSRFTRDFEQLVAWLAVKMDKDALRRLVQVDWDTVGRICDRVVADELDPGRLDDLYDIGVDEISWKKHHNYLTLVVNHTTNKVVWGAEGKNTKTLDGFFDELGEARSAQIRAVSMDMGPAFRKSVVAEGHAPQATICFDPFHVVKLATDALNTVRRDIWQQLRRLPDPDISKKFKGARWALMKNPEDLTTRQATTLTAIKRHGGELWRAYQRKEGSPGMSVGRSWPALPGEGEVDGAAGEHHQGEGGLGGVEPERPSDDETYAAVEALETSVREAALDRGEDPVAVGADGAGGLDERFESGALRAGTPPVEQLDGLVSFEVAREDGAKFLLSLVGAPQCPAVGLDRLERDGLPVGEVLWVLQQRPPRTLELLGQRRVG
jgi:hypothetical protein